MIFGCKLEVKCVEIVNGNCFLKLWSYLQLTYMQQFWRASFKDEKAIIFAKSYGYYNS